MIGWYLLQGDGEEVSLKEHTNEGGADGMGVGVETLACRLLLLLLLLHASLAL